MICSKCKKRNAVYLYEEIIGGKRRKYALCAECGEGVKNASTLHGQESSFTFPFSFSINDADNLFSTLFYGASATQSTGKRCSLCGLKFEDIIREGKVGCPLCYTTFRDELSPSISRIHGADQHKGKAPRGYVASEPTPEGHAEAEPVREPSKEEQKTKKLKELKAALEEAILSEEYEEAAKIRDQIKALEGEA
ncbi:MAG: UvrB/UvrC motif-containing protein [Clostridia bacterium]|nr:UvrB/UvrC motif-containing protein [Clostridia bacterium]